MTEHTATVIDNIFSNTLQDDILSDNVLLTLSDHFAQMVSVNREQIQCVSKRLLKVLKRVSEMFQFKIGLILATMFKDVYTELEASVDRHAPLKKLTPKEITIKSKPWLSTEILKMIKFRNKIFAMKKGNLKMRTVKDYIIY